MEVIRENELTKVSRMDEVGAGGAHHRYCVTSPDCKSLFVAADFQHGGADEVMLAGAHNEDLLAIVIDRLECFQAGPFPCAENHMALACLGEALNCLEARTEGRKERGVEGKSEA